MSLSTLAVIARILHLRPTVTTAPPDFIRALQNQLASTQRTTLADLPLAEVRSPKGQG